jgi:hypothetical protein
MTDAEYERLSAEIPDYEDPGPTLVFTADDEIVTPSGKRPYHQDKRDEG